MNFEEALKAIKEGKKVRLPEWRGYWFGYQNENEGEIKALTKDGEIKDAWASAYMDRLDWEIANGLDFGWAICALKAGKMVTRAGWKEKGGFVFLRPADAIPENIVIHNVKSLPKLFKDYLLKNPVEWDNGGDLGFTAYFCFFDGVINNGWVPSAGDILSEDWQLFEP